jgi:AmmeMemoRadiSam system protein A
VSWEKMVFLSESERKTALGLARGALENFLDSKPLVDESAVKKLPKKFFEKKAVFVSLHSRGTHELRGCIGCLEAEVLLWKNIVENAVRAGACDPRFPPLSKAELKRVEIEVSVLSELKPLEFSNEGELLEKFTRGKGVLLRKGGRSATFLPQVWEQLPDKREFLEHLALKAGLPAGGWHGAEFFVYEVQAFND